MAQQYSTGAILYYVKFGGGSTPFFLGTQESRPRIENRPSYLALHNDLSGAGDVPLDMSFQGMTALNSIVLTRWNEPVVRFIEQQPNPLASGAVAGSWAIRDVGTLMALENKAMELWIVLPNSTTLSYSSLPAAYHYPSCIVWNPMTLEGGTSPAKRHLLFYSWPKLDIPNSKFTLWDADVTGLPAID